MGDIQRWSMEIAVPFGKYSYGHETVGHEHDPDGEWVKFTDHERVVAEKDARIKELEGALKRLLAGAQENPNGMGRGLSTFHLPPLSQHLYLKYRAIQKGANNE